MKRAYTEACVHIEFVMELYKDQLAGNRCFLHEHPMFASSWSLESVQQLSQAPGVAIVRSDQCQYGAEAPHGAFKGSPVMKPTGFVSNSTEIRANCPSGVLRAPGAYAAGPREDDTRHAPEGYAKKFQSTPGRCAEQFYED